LLKFLESFCNVRLRNDCIAFKDAPGAPAADLHNDAFCNARTSQIAGSSAAKIVEEQAGYSCGCAGVGPGFAEVSNRLSVRACEHGVVGRFARYALREQVVDRARHRDFSAVVVLGRSRLQSNGSSFHIDLTNLEVDEFADAPAIGAAHLHDCLEPEVGAVCNELPILGVFEEPSADVVLHQLGELWQSEDLWRGGVHPDAKHPLERGHLAIDRRV
jgi:hypothetical protein